MANDFPILLTGAIDNTTEILAKHINNLEGKVGVNNSTVSTSLDYLLRSPASIEPGHKHYKLWSSDGAVNSVLLDSLGRMAIISNVPSQAYVASDLYSTAMFFSAGDGYAGFGASDYDENGIPLHIGADSFQLTVTAGIAMTVKTTGVVNLVFLTSYANNAAAVAGGLVAGDLYRLGDTVGVVH